MSVSRPGSMIVDADTKEATIGFLKPLIIEKGPNDSNLSFFQLKVETILNPLTHNALWERTTDFDFPLLPEENNITASVLGSIFVSERISSLSEFRNSEKSKCSSDTSELSSSTLSKNTKLLFLLLNNEKLSVNNQSTFKFCRNE